MCHYAEYAPSLTAIIIDLIVMDASHCNLEFLLQRESSVSKGIFPKLREGR